jgi:hypothetical protein
MDSFGQLRATTQLPVSHCKNGGDNGTRTCGLCRDSAAGIGLNNLEDTRGLPNAVQVIPDLSTCGLGCGLEICRQSAWRTLLSTSNDLRLKLDLPYSGNFTVRLT